MIFIDDFSRYTKVYLLRHKDEAFDMFLSYKVDVENQLNKKIERVRSDRCGEFMSLHQFLFMSTLLTILSKLSCNFT